MLPPYALQASKQTFISLIQVTMIFPITSQSQKISTRTSQEADKQVSHVSEGVCSGMF